MDLLELLFKIIEKFVPINTVKFASVENDAKDWEKGILGKPEDKKNAFERFYTKYSTAWYFRLFLAIAYIPLFQYIMGLMQPETSELDLEGE